MLRRAGERAVIRPSGTEPKLKAYLQVVEPVEDDLAAARAAADARLGALRDRGRGADQRPRLRRPVITGV